MYSKISKVTIVLCCGLIFLATICDSLKCRSDDGPSDEEIKKVVQTCMKKIGGNNSLGGNDMRRRYNNDRDDSDYERDRDDNDYDNYNNNNNNNHNNNNYNNYGNHRRSQGNRYKRQSMQHQNDQQWNNAYNYQDQNQGYSNNNDRNSNQSDKSCIVQCFFQEMKMTSNDGFPDKHKMLQIMTKDIKDHDMKEFYTDSIEECFHILEMEQRNEKCSFSKNIVDCLTERAKANCDDFRDETVIF